MHGGTPCLGGRAAALRKIPKKNLKNLRPATSVVTCFCPPACLTAAPLSALTHLPPPTLILHPQRPDLDDLDEDMLEELVAQYNFGGGEEGGEGGEGEGGVAARGPDGKPKTRKQVGPVLVSAGATVVEGGGERLAGTWGGS